MGKHKYIETPEKLWELFEEYVLHEKQNPMYKTEYVGKDGRTELTPLETPITFEGFECYLEDKGIISHLSDYSANKDNKYSEYSTIIMRIKRNCFVHNFRGASVGLFNANIIAKKLGLSEKVETQQTIIQRFDFDVND